jgi:hypothetical protein
VRQYIDIINEATKPTKTGTKDKTGFDFMPSLEPGGAVATAGAAKRDVAPGLPGKKSRKRVRSINAAPEVGAQAGQHFAQLGNVPDMHDEIDDAEARRRAGVGDDDMGAADDGVPEPVNIENLPAIINKEITETDGRFHPEWHQIKNLPRYIQQPIRALGRQIFGQFTDTPIEDIQMIGTIGNINPTQEVQGMMAWITKNGIRDQDAKMDFGQIMPGYEADTSLWNTKDFTFLLVKDFAGYYVYGWVGGREFHVGHHEPKMIESEQPKKKVNSKR